jgi:hypothetical protein
MTVKRKYWQGVNGMNEEHPSHTQFEARLIQLLRWRFEKSNLGFIDHLKVGDLPLEIDVVVISSKRDWQPDFGKFPRLFEYFRRHNVMEVKTEQNRLKVEDLPKLLAYGWLYVSRSHIVEVTKVTATALVHHLTPRVKKALPKFGFVPKSQGIYWRDADMPACVISFTDLPDELMTEELRAFSDPARRQQTFLACLGNKEKAPIAETIFDLYESEVRKIMLNIREETLRNVFSVVDPKRIVAALGEEKIIAALGDEKIIAALGDEKIIAALGDEKIIAALGDEKIIAALGDEKIIAALGKQKLQAALSKEDLLAAVNREEMINALVGNESFLKALLAKLDAEQLRKMLEEKTRH